MFAILACLVTFVLVAAHGAETRDNPWARDREFWEKFWHIGFSLGTLVFVLPVAVAAAHFCYSLSRAAKRVA